MEQEKEDWMAVFNRKHNCHLNEKKNKKKIQKKNEKQKNNPFKYKNIRKQD